MRSLMDMRKLTITNTIFIYTPIKRLLTCVAATLKKQHQMHQRDPPSPPHPVLQPQTNPQL
jgi:hypothetical protein